MDTPQQHQGGGSRVRNHVSNRETLLPGKFFKPVTRAELEEAYARVRARHMAMPQHGYRLYWVQGIAMGSFDLPLRQDGYAIVGRHTHCDLCLEGEPTMANRHLLLRVQRLTDQSIALRIMDLQSSLGFFLAGDEKMRSIFATGPISFRIGGYAFVAVPSDVDLPDEPPRSLLEQAEAPPPSLPAGAPYRVPAERRSGAISRITMLPAPPLLSDLEPARAGQRRITLVRENRRASVDLTDEQLDVGVLLGRADKCLDAGLRFVLNECVSRVHALLWREGGAYYAFDTGSTNGMLHDGKLVRRIRLPDEGTVFTLSRHLPVHVYWHASR